MNAATSIKRAMALCRTPVALFTSYSAVTGCLLAPHGSFRIDLAVFSAVFILACGASAFNQYQERDIDARMERTRHRPLPTRAVSPFLALFCALALIFSGLAMLALAGGKGPAFLGMMAVLWYNGVYTYLKRITAFAAVPGAVVGMIPPAIGWTAAGGGLADPRLFIVCFLFFLWQVPHFWLQLLHHGEEYEKAGLPSLTKALTRRQLTRVTFAWMCSTATAGLLLPLYGGLTSAILSFSLIPAAAWIMITGIKLTASQRTSAFLFTAFRQLNAYIVFVMALLTAQGLFNSLP
jgi:protoheme IX farnesyltransferase